MRKLPASTTFTIAGHAITSHFGVARGIVVRSRNVFGSIFGSLQTLFGGDISMFTQLCEDARNDAYGRMLDHVRQLGGNAVVGVRYDANEIMAGVTEVLCYGTAVWIVPDSDGTATGIAVSATSPDPLTASGWTGRL